MLLLLETVLILILCLNSCFSAKLNAPRILLPYSVDIFSDYNLVVTEVNIDDCFQWTSSNPLVVKVTPFYEDGCSQKATVSVAGTFRTRQVTRVTATSHDNNTLVCDVVTDTPTFVDLIYTTKHLYVDAQPEVLTLTASDSQGGSFSSFNGLPITWNLYPKSETHNKECDALSLKLFSTSSYTSHINITALEVRGLYGSAVLVQPLSVGSCSISASLKIPDLKQLYTDEIEISVSSNYEISLSNPMYLLKLSFVVPYWRSIGDGKLIDDPIFDTNIHDGGEVIAFDKDLKTLTASEYGESHLEFTKNNEEKTNVEVHVVKIASLNIRVYGKDLAVLEDTQVYVILVELFDENINEIFCSDNLKLTVKFPSQLFYLHSSTSNGTYYVVQAISPGKGVIRATFDGLTLPNGTLFKETAVSHTLNIRILQKLQVQPSKLLLPFGIASHNVKLKVSGGSGRFTCVSNDPLTVSANVEEHICDLDIQGTGEFTVAVIDQSNAQFFATSRISVQNVVDIEAFPSVVEAEVGNTIMLPIGLFGYETTGKKNLKKFDDCSKINVSTDIIEKRILTVVTEPHIPAFGKGCRTLQFHCKSAGHSRIMISHQPSDGSTALKTTTFLACFKPLQAVHPVRVAVVAVSATKEVAFDGGPRKWPLKKLNHQTILTSNVPGLLDIELLPDPIRYNRDLTVFRIRCKNAGESTLNFKISNEPSATNIHPASQETSIKIVCGQPVSLHLKLNKKSKRDSEKLSENVVKVPFYGNKEFEIDISVKDSKGRLFSNISVFDINFEIPDKALIDQKTELKGFSTHENAVNGYKRVSRNFKTFKMTGEVGSLVIKATVRGYRKDILLNEDIDIVNETFKEISSEISLQLISLRDINAGLHSNDNKVDSCDGDSCKY